MLSDIEKEAVMKIYQKLESDYDERVKNNELLEDYDERTKKEQKIPM